eukprot:jgi/Botrbrau1/313/Bobra.0022s0276.1
MTARNCLLVQVDSKYIHGGSGYKCQKTSRTPDGITCHMENAHARQAEEALRL